MFSDLSMLGSTLRTRLCFGSDAFALDTSYARHFHAVESEAKLRSLSHSLARGTSFGSTRWQTTTAKQLGPESFLRPPALRTGESDQPTILNCHSLFGGSLHGSLRGLSARLLRQFRSPVHSTPSSPRSVGVFGRMRPPCFPDSRAP